MRTETEPKTEVFLAKPTETDRWQNFWNRNNTSHNTLAPGKIYIISLLLHAHTNITSNLYEIRTSSEYIAFLKLFTLLPMT